MHLLHSFCAQSRLVFSSNFHPPAALFTTITITSWILCIRLNETCMHVRQEKCERKKSVFVFVINLITLVTHEQVRATSIRGSVFVQLSSLLIAKIKLDRIRVSGVRECEGFVVSIARIASIRLSTVIFSDCLCLCAQCTVQVDLWSARAHTSCNLHPPPKVIVWKLRTGVCYFCMTGGD